MWRWDQGFAEMNKWLSRADTLAKCHGLIVAHLNSVREIVFFAEANLFCKRKYYRAI